MDATALQHAFLLFVGDEKYRAFIAQLNRERVSLDRLRFWQQRLWDSFVEADPRWPTDFALAREAFRICELHDYPLLQDTVYAPLAYSPMRQAHSPDMRRPRAPSDFQKFPYPGWGIDPKKWGEPEDTKLIETWYCPECRTLRAAWEADHGSNTQD